MVSAGQKNPFDRCPSVRMEHKVIKTAESRSILVLFANGLLENIDLDMARIFRQPGRRKKSLKARVQVLN